MFQQDKTKCSYLGGLVDGEGNICVWRTEARAKDYKTSGKTYGSFNLRLHIANTSLTLMKWLVSNFGGVYHTKREATDKHATAYEWRPKGEGNTKRTLLAILPYLVIKREQAILALKYIELPQQAPEAREAIYQRMRQLNQKGPKTVETNTSSIPAGPRQFWDTIRDGSLLAPSIAYHAGLKIESELTGDRESEPVVIQGLDGDYTFSV